MGAYLNKAITTKESETGGNEQLQFAATCMQGWRINQEDAHNCIVNFHDDWSLFAVYDGHGGPEVAKYASEEFPKFLLEKEFWKSEEYEKILQSAFIDFDDHLRSEETSKKLKVLAGQLKPKKDAEADDDKSKMYEEGAMPLNELLARYGVQLIGGPGIGAHKLLQGIADEEESDSEDDEEEENKVEEIEDEEEESEKQTNGETDETDDEKKKGGVTKRVCESPIQEEAKRAKTEEEKEKKKENGTKLVQNGTTNDELDADEAENKEPSNEEKESTNEKKETPILKIREKTTTTVVKTEKKVVEASEEDAGDSSSEDDVDYKAEEDDEEEEDEMDDESEDDDEDFDEMDMNDCSHGMEVPGQDSGTTACVCLISKDKLVVSNVGDSRAVLSRSGKAFDLSFDHKPEDKVEIERIHKAGGRVTDDGRVNGGLNLSRAFGDHVYKKTENLPLAEQMISALPDVKIEAITPEDQFLIIACDGIWNSMTSQEAIDFVKERIDKGTELKQICEEICDACLADSTSGDGTGCDNMTVIIANLTDRQVASIN